MAFQKYVIPAKQRILWGQEAVATPGTAATAWTLEPCQSVRTDVQRNQYEAKEYVGFPAESIDLVELTHHAQVTITCPYRANGIAPFALAALMGDHTDTGTTETVATGVHTIIPGINSSRCPTFSIMHDTGVSGGTDVLQMLYATVQSVKLSFAPNNPLMAEVVFLAYFPTVQTYPSSGITLVSPGTRTLGYQGAFNIYGNSGTQYTTKFLGGDLTVSREVEVIETASQNQQNPLDLIPGPLKLVSTLDMLYDGAASSSSAPRAYGDFLQFLSIGSSSAVNEMKWTDTDGNYLDVYFYPAKWSNLNWQEGQATLKLNGTLTAFQDYTQATAATPALTVVKQLVIKNGGATKYIIDA